MNKQQIIMSATISSLLTVGVMATLLVGLSWTATTSSAKETLWQAAPENIAYVSISGLQFMPLNQTAVYNKDVTRQLLQITGQTRPFRNPDNLFIAPLNLPDNSRIRGLTVFGQDADGQGEIRLRLQRCDHGQARCTTLGETTSTVNYAAGQFETARVPLIDEVVDNYFYSYLLEAELTALFNSGLRTVRLEIRLDQADGPPDENVNSWILTGTQQVFPIPNSQLAFVRICTNDLSHLNNPTHFPTLYVDDELIPLESNECVEVWGEEIEIRRNPNAGESSGTFEILR